MGLPEVSVVIGGRFQGSDSAYVGLDAGARKFEAIYGGDGGCELTVEPRDLSELSGLVESDIEVGRGGEVAERELSPKAHP